MFNDAEEFVRRCDEYHRVKVSSQKDNMPLRPMMGARDFYKWGIDFINPIDPQVMKPHAQYIIAATNYVTKRVEVKAT